jgi:ubiquinone/menaquinone biosynthesis C-methylase UbiE
MSHYEAYDQTSGHYDTTRTAIGLEIWLGHLVSNFSDITKTQILDAGCGTGNYALALAPRVGCVTGLDLNEPMLTKAREKAVASELADKTAFQLGELPELPFADGTFDAVMLNQVLHHLEPLGSIEFHNHVHVINEAARVLRKGGLVMINACSRAQMKEAYWYHSLIPEASRRGLTRTIATDALKAALVAAGFSSISRTVPLDALLQGEASLDPYGPLDASWRAGDSIWALASNEELDSAIERVTALREQGLLQDFMAERDDARKSIGQTTFWCARATW